MQVIVCINSIHTWAEEKNESVTLSTSAIKFYFIFFKCFAAILA